MVDFGKNWLTAVKKGAIFDRSHPFFAEVNHFLTAKDGKIASRGVPLDCAVKIDKIVLTVDLTVRDGCFVFFRGLQEGVGRAGRVLGDE